MPRTRPGIPINPVWRQKHEDRDNGTKPGCSKKNGGGQGHRHHGGSGGPCGPLGLRRRFIRFVRLHLPAECAPTGASAPGSASSRRPDGAPDDGRQDRRRGRRRQLGHLLLEGRPVRPAARGRAALARTSRARSLERHSSDSQVRQCLPADRPHLQPRPQQHIRRHHRHQPRQAGRQRRLPVRQHLATGDGREEPARVAVRAWRQQYLGLHGRPAVRRRKTGEGRQRGGHHRQLPPRHPGLSQHAAAEAGRHRGRRLRQLRAARTTWRRYGSSRTTLPTSAAIRATSRCRASRPAPPTCCRS